MNVVRGDLIFGSVPTIENLERLQGECTAGKRANTQVSDRKGVFPDICTFKCPQLIGFSLFLFGRGGSDVAWWSCLYHLELWVPWTKPLLPFRARGSRHESRSNGTRRGMLTSPPNKTIQVEFLHLLFVNPGKCTYFLKRRLKFFIISSLFHFV